MHGNIIDLQNEFILRNKMKICVTGGAGFIGTNFLFYMMKKYPDYKFVCIDSLTYAGNKENLNPLFDKENSLTFFKVDITHKEHINCIFKQEKFDIVVNFAAESHVDNSIKNSDIFIKTNIVGTHVLLEASKKYGVKRFHQVSTDEVYGSLQLGEDTRFYEDMPLDPSSPYSASKASADLLVMSYYRTYGLPITISRCSNNYGPYQFEEKLIPRMIKCAVNDELLPVYGKGMNVRDWIHVEDHCIAIDKIIHDGTVGEIYNVGGNSELTNIQVIKSILYLLGKPESLISFVTDRLGHDLRYAIDYSKIRNELEWNPKYTFDKGLKETVAWYITK